MMQRRCLFEIYANVLTAVSSGFSKPTRIMYRANLSWLPLQRHLHLLVRGGFLKETQLKSRKIYDITDRGRRFLHYYNLAKNELTQGNIGLPKYVDEEQVKELVPPRKSATS